jgi:hypothetical protein
VAAPVFAAITNGALRVLNVAPDSALKDLVKTPEMMQQVSMQR